MRQRETKHHPQPAGREGRLDGLWRTDEFQFSSELEKLDAVADEVSSGADLRGILSRTEEFLAGRGLPSRPGAIAVESSGDWWYLESNDDRPNSGLCCALSAAIRALGCPVHTVQWHAAAAAEHAQFALKTEDRDMAVFNTVRAARYFERFELQARGLEDAAAAGRRQKLSEGRPKSWIKNHKREFYALCEEKRKTRDGDPKDARKIREAAAREIAQRHGLENEPIPGDTKLREIWATNS